MSQGTASIRIAIYGPECASKGERHGCGLWDAGVASCVVAAEGQPVPLPEVHGKSWDDVLRDIHGIVVTGSDDSPRRSTSEVEGSASGAGRTVFRSWPSITACTC